MGALPRETRFALYRRMVDCDANPDPRLTLGIAATQADLEACFSLLHDAYVACGFMQPHRSGLRVTPYHALPTTTTLFARFDDQIVGTLSIIREGEFGFPLQSAFDLSAVRVQPGRVAEISALAIHPRFRSTGGSILFPLMKFMYEYCTRYFDTRHLVIAVNPKHIEMYESLLFFRRLQSQVVNNYDFVNGAPAVGATLDLWAAPAVYKDAYDGRRPERNLHHYFTQVALPNIRMPDRPYFTTNDPVMSPELLDHFFNQRTQVFADLSPRQQRLLHAIYPEERYRAVLPSLSEGACGQASIRRYHRYSLKCPAYLTDPRDTATPVPLEVIDVSAHGFLARSTVELPDHTRGLVRVQLGAEQVAVEQALLVRRAKTSSGSQYGFRIEEPGAVWRQCIRHLEVRETPRPEGQALASSDDVGEFWVIDSPATA
jgi:GNAT superfamily N-acetyltransferase